MRDLEDLVHRLQLTYDEVVDILDVKNIAGSTIGYKLPPGVYEIIDLILILKSLLPNDVKVKFTIDDIRLKSILTRNKTIRVTKKSFFYVILRFTQSHLGELGDIEGFVYLILGTYKSDKPVNFTAIDKIHLEANCINGSYLNGVQHPILYSFALDKPPGRKINNQPRIKLLRQMNKSVLSHSTFYPEDDNHKPVSLF